MRWWTERDAAAGLQVAEEVLGEDPCEEGDFAYMTIEGWQMPELPPHASSR